MLFLYYGPAGCLMKGGRGYCYHCDYCYSHDGDDDDDDDYLLVFKHYFVVIMNSRTKNIHIHYI